MQHGAMSKWGVPILTWIAFVLVLLFIAAVMSPTICTARPAARTASCMSNLKQIARAGALYMDDHDDHLPRAENWQDAFAPYLRNTNIFNCPEASRSPASYAYNATLDRARRKEIVDPASAPFAYDSFLPGPNATDWLQSFARRHEWSGKKGWGNVAFVDGHAHAFRTAPPAGAGLRQANP